MRRWLLTLMIATTAAGCANPPRPHPARLYYRHQYPDARDALRDEAANRRSGTVILDNLRLGLAALADGDVNEADTALMRAYEYLVGGGVNPEDRKIAATLLAEDIKVWTGEPYEQAMSFYYVAVLSMLRGEWDNARAAIRNSLFSLHAFALNEDGEPKNMARVVTDAAKANADPVEMADQIDSQFALGHVLAGLCEVQLASGHEAKPHFDKVRSLNPELTSLIEALRGGDFDTLLVIDYGRGPIKTAYGPDDALVRYVPDGRRGDRPVLAVRVDDKAVQTPGAQPVVDLWALSQYPRWWSLESIRRAKSAVGHVLLVGGGIAAGAGAAADSEPAQWAGLGALATGLGLKGAARADTRQLAMLPRCVYLVPLTLGEARRDVSLSFSTDRMADATWHDLSGGERGRPAVYYLRQHAEAPGMPRWSDRPLYFTAHTDRPDDLRPYILGGRDLAAPDPSNVDTYRRQANLGDLTLADLKALCRAEGIVFTPGPQGRTGKAARASTWYRHVAEGGRVLWSPPPGTHAHERLTRREHPPYAPHRDRLKRALERYAPPVGEPPGDSPGPPHGVQ